MSNPLVQTIQRIRKSGRVALCGYFPAGYRTPEIFYRAVREAEQLDIIEFGIPSVNPYLDGELIENAHKMVVEERGVLTETSLALIGGLKKTVQPRFVMTYANDGRALQGFFRLCVEHHIQGVFAPDISLEESSDVSAYATSLNLAYISFIHTGMSESEMLLRASQSQIVYLKLSSGTTGAYAQLDGGCGALRSTNDLLRGHFLNLIVAAGIGIKEPSQIARCADIGADMVIVGTTLIRKMNQSPGAMTQTTAQMHAATYITTNPKSPSIVK